MEHGGGCVRRGMTRVMKHSVLRPLVPYSRVLSYRSVKRAQMQAGGLHISQPNSIKSRVLLRCCVQSVQTYPFHLHITWQILGSYSIREFRKEKINTLDHYPIPYPPLPAVRLAQSDYMRSRLTTNLVQAITS